MSTKIVTLACLIALFLALPFGPRINAQVFPMQVEGASSATFNRDGCLSVTSFGARAWDLNQAANGSTLVGISWKAEVKNSCSSSWTAELTYDLLPEVGPSLGSSSKTVHIPPLVEDYPLSGSTFVGIDQVFLISSAAVTIDALKIDLLEPAEPCLSAVHLKPLNLNIVEPFGSFPEISSYGSALVSFKSNVVNRCSFDIFATIQTIAYDKDGYFLSEEENQVAVEAFGESIMRFTKSARRTRQEFAEHYVATSIRENPISKSVFVHSEIRWLNSIISELDAASGRLSISGEVGNIGYFSYDLVIDSASDQPQLSIDKFSFKKLTSQPRLGSDYDSSNNILTIPVIRSTQGLIFENVKLQLVDLDKLTFELKSFSHPPGPSTLDTTKLQCVEIESVSSSEFIDEEKTAHYSASIKLKNHCVIGQQRIFLRHRLLDQNDFILHTEFFPSLNLERLEVKEVHVSYSRDSEAANRTPVREEFIVGANLGHGLL